MATILLGTPSVEKIIEVLDNLKYHNSNLEEFYNPHKDIESRFGIMRYIDATIDFDTERAYVEKLRMAKNLLEKHSDEAIDEYVNLTEVPSIPEEWEDYMGAVNSFGGDLKEIFESCFIPMKKEELRNYVEAYTSWINRR